HVVRQVEHLECHAVLEAVDAGDAVGHGQHGADLGQVGLAGLEALDARLEDGGDLVGLDLQLNLLSPSVLASSDLGRRYPALATCLRSCSRRLRTEASSTELPTRTTMPPRRSGSTLADRSTLRPVCSAIRSPICLTVP